MNFRQYLAGVLFFHLTVAFATPEDSTSLRTFPAFNLDVVLHSLDNPWAMAEISPNVFLITCKPGKLLRVEQGKLSGFISGVPQVFNQSQGGLLDIALHPDFKQNQWIYLSFAQGTANHNHLSVMRAKLIDNHLADTSIIFSVSPDKNTPVHYGGRMAFLADKTLVISVGDGFDFREQAQLKSSQLGKLIRIKDDGSLPADNPFSDQQKADPFIWSLGHRNPQGLAFDKKRQILFEHEHGPAGGDEVNLIEKGHNYGWPVITKGMDYSGAMISPYKSYPGMEQPVVDWTPSIAPSSMQVYYGDMFKAINGDLLVTTLKSKELRWLVLKDHKVVKQRSLLKHLNQRMRNVFVSHDGSIYLLTDGNDAKLLRLSAKSTKTAPTPETSTIPNKPQPESA